MEHKPREAVREKQPQDSGAFLHLAALQQGSEGLRAQMALRPFSLLPADEVVHKGAVYPPPNYIMYNQSFFDLWAVQFSEASNNYLCLMYLGSREYWLLDRFGMLPVTQGHASPATSSSPDWPPRA